MTARRITSPDDPALAELCATLAERAVVMDRTGEWPAGQLRLCGEYGVFEWFLDPRWGGQRWSEEQLVRGYLALRRGMPDDDVRPHAADRRSAAALPEVATERSKSSCCPGS